MNNKSLNKFIFPFLLCAIVASNSISSSAEEINIEKINFELGISCLKQNDYRQAIKYFELVVQKNPKNIEAHYNLALAYKKYGMSEKSVSEFDRVVKLLNDPQNFEAKGIDINKLRQENRILHSSELASDKYELYSKVKSQENDYIDLGDMHFDNQQFETAIEYYNLALQINPYNDFTYFKIAKSYMDAGNYLQAEPYITRAVELTPQNPKYTYYKDIVVKSIGSKYYKNIDLREKIVNKSINRKDPMQGFELPEEYKKELFAEEEKSTAGNKPEPYVEEIINPENAVIQPNKTSKIKKLFVKKQNINKSIAAEEKKQEIKPENAGNFTQGKSQELDYLDLADLHYDNQEFETALEYYTLALNINSNNDYTYYKIARCFIDMKQYRNADEYINKALVLSSMNKKYLFFKNEIASNLNSAENTTLAFKSPEDFSKNKVNVNSNKVSKLNPNLKMIAEDPKIISEETIIEDEPDVSNAKLPEISPVNKTQKVNVAVSNKANKPAQHLAVIPNLIRDLTNSALSLKSKNGKMLNQVQHDNQQVQSNNDPVTTQKLISSVETTTPSVFGKDMKYYQTQEPEQTKPADIQYEKPMQTEPQEQQYSPDYYNEKGIEYFKRDNMQKAENFFKKAIELKPMYAKAYNNLANVEAKRGNFDIAIQYNLQALTIDPYYPESYYNLALIYKKRKDFINEIAYLDKAVQADPKYYQAYFTRGLSYYNAGNYEQAKYNFKEVLKLKNDHYLASQNLGIIYANELNKTEAENYLKTAIRLNKNNATSYYYLASIYQTTGSVFDAIENYRKTIELDPANYKAYLALAKSYEQNDEIDRAIDILNDAIQLNQSNAEPYNCLGLLYLKKDKYIEATNSFQKAISINSNRSVYHYNLSQSYICLNMKNKAKVEFERAVNIQPATIQDYIDLSEIFYDRSMPSYSIKVLKDGIAALPDNDYLYVVLSRFYEKTGAITSAKKLLTDYLVKKPNGTLSLLIQRKLSSMENTVNNGNNSDL